MLTLFSEKQYSFCHKLTAPMGNGVGVYSIHARLSVAIYTCHLIWH